MCIYIYICIDTVLYSSSGFAIQHTFHWGSAVPCQVTFLASACCDAGVGHVSNPGAFANLKSWRIPSRYHGFQVTKSCASMTLTFGYI